VVSPAGLLFSLVPALAGVREKGLTPVWEHDGCVCMTGMGKDRRA